MPQIKRFEENSFLDILLTLFFLPLESQNFFSLMNFLTSLGSDVLVNI